MSGRRIGRILMAALALGACAPVIATPTPARVAGGPVPSAVVLVTTSTPIGAPAPTQTPAPPSPIAPPAVVVNATEMAATAVSGGLGLARGPWEMMHGRPFRDDCGDLRVYENGKLQVGLVYGRIVNVRYVWKDDESRSLEAARLEARRRMPADARPVRHLDAAIYRPTQDPFVTDIYTSAWLATRWAGQPDADLLFDGVPGSFVVYYGVPTRLDAVRVTTLILALGAKPSP